jgi:hypothetical protein
VRYEVLAIDNPFNCGIRPIIRFLLAKIMNVEETHRDLCAAVYGQNVMREGKVRVWRRMFKDRGGEKNIHDEQGSGRPSVVSEDLVQSIDKKTEKRRFTISELSCEFP